MTEDDAIRAELRPARWPAEAELWIRAGNSTHRCAGHQDPAPNFTPAAAKAVDRASCTTAMAGSWRMSDVRVSRPGSAAGGDGVEQLEVELESSAHQHTDSGEVSLVVRTDKPL
jgi:hypothetical protein